MKQIVETAIETHAPASVPGPAAATDLETPPTERPVAQGVDGHPLPVLEERPPSNDAPDPERDRYAKIAEETVATVLAAGPPVNGEPNQTTPERGRYAKIAEETVATTLAAGPPMEEMESDDEEEKKKKKKRHAAEENENNRDADVSETRQAEEDTENARRQDSDKLSGQVEDSPEDAGEDGVSWEMTGLCAAGLATLSVAFSGGGGGDNGIASRPSGRSGGKTTTTTKTMVVRKGEITPAETVIKITPDKTTGTSQKSETATTAEDQESTETKTEGQTTTTVEDQESTETKTEGQTTTTVEDQESTETKTEGQTTTTVEDQESTETKTEGQTATTAEDQESTETKTEGQTTTTVEDQESTETKTEGQTTTTIQAESTSPEVEEGNGDANYKKIIAIIATVFVGIGIGLLGLLKLKRYWKKVAVPSESGSGAARQPAAAPGDDGNAPESGSDTSGDGDDTPEGGTGATPQASRSRSWWRNPLPNLWPLRSATRRQSAAEPVDGIEEERQAAEPQTGRGNPLGWLRNPFGLRRSPPTASSPLPVSRPATVLSPSGVPVSSWEERQAAVPQTGRGNPLGWLRNPFRRLRSTVPNRQPAEEVAESSTMAAAVPEVRRKHISMDEIRRAARSILQEEEDQNSNFRKLLELCVDTFKPGLRLITSEIGSQPDIRSRLLEHLMCARRNMETFLEEDLPRDLYSSEPAQRQKDVELILSAWDKIQKTSQESSTMAAAVPEDGIEEERQAAVPEDGIEEERQAAVPQTGRGNPLGWLRNPFRRLRSTVPNRQPAEEVAESSTMAAAVPEVRRKHISMDEIRRAARSILQEEEDQNSNFRKLLELCLKKYPPSWSKGDTKADLNQLMSNSIALRRYLENCLPKNSFGNTYQGDKDNIDKIIKYFWDLESNNRVCDDYELEKQLHKALYEVEQQLTLHSDVMTPSSTHPRQATPAGKSSTMTSQGDINVRIRQVMKAILSKEGDQRANFKKLLELYLEKRKKECLYLGSDDLFNIPLSDSSRLVDHMMREPDAMKVFLDSLPPNFFSKDSQRLLDIFWKEYNKILQESSTANSSSSLMATNVRGSATTGVGNLWRSATTRASNVRRSATTGVGNLWRSATTRASNALRSAMTRASNALRSAMTRASNALRSATNSQKQLIKDTAQLTQRAGKLFQKETKLHQEKVSAAVDNTEQSPEKQRAEVLDALKNLSDLLTPRHIPYSANSQYKKLVYRIEYTLGFLYSLPNLDKNEKISRYVKDIISLIGSIILTNNTQSNNTQSSVLLDHLKNIKNIITDFFGSEAMEQPSATDLKALRVKRRLRKFLSTQELNLAHLLDDGNIQYLQSVPILSELQGRINNLLNSLIEKPFEIMEAEIFHNINVLLEKACVLLSKELNLRDISEDLVRRQGRNGLSDDEKKQLVKQTMRFRLSGLLARLPYNKNKRLETGKKLLQAVRDINEAISSFTEKQNALLRETGIAPGTAPSARASHAEAAAALRQMKSLKTLLEEATTPCPEEQYDHILCPEEQRDQLASQIKNLRYQIVNNGYLLSDIFTRVRNQQLLDQELLDQELLDELLDQELLDQELLDQERQECLNEEFSAAMGDILKLLAECPLRGISERSGSRKKAEKRSEALSSALDEAMKVLEQAPPRLTLPRGRPVAVSSTRGAPQAPPRLTLPRGRPVAVSSTRAARGAPQGEGAASSSRTQESTAAAVVGTGGVSTTTPTATPAVAETRARTALASLNNLLKKRRSTSCPEGQYEQLGERIRNTENFLLTIRNFTLVQDKELLNAIENILAPLGRHILAPSPSAEGELQSAPLASALDDVRSTLTAVVEARVHEAVQNLNALLAEYQRQVIPDLWNTLKELLECLDGAVSSTRNQGLRDAIEELRKLVKDKLGTSPSEQEITNEAEEQSEALSSTLDEVLKALKVLKEVLADPEQEITTVGYMTLSPETLARWRRLELQISQELLRVARQSTVPTAQEWRPPAAATSTVAPTVMETSSEHVRTQALEAVATLRELLAADRTTPCPEGQYDQLASQIDETLVFLSRIRVRDQELLEAMENILAPLGRHILAPSPSAEGELRSALLASALDQIRPTLSAVAEQERLALLGEGPPGEPTESVLSPAGADSESNLVKDKSTTARTEPVEETKSTEQVGAESKVKKSTSTVEADSESNLVKDTSTTTTMTEVTEKIGSTEQVPEPKVKSRETIKKSTSTVEADSESNLVKDKSTTARTEPVEETKSTEQVGAESKVKDAVKSTEPTDKVEVGLESEGVRETAKPTGTSTGFGEAAGGSTGTSTGFGEAAKSAEPTEKVEIIDETPIVEDRPVVIEAHSGATAGPSAAGGAEAGKAIKKGVPARNSRIHTFSDFSGDPGGSTGTSTGSGEPAKLVETAGEGAAEEFKPFGGTGRTPDGKPVEDAPETVGKESTVKDPAKSTGETSGTGSGDPAKLVETAGEGAAEEFKPFGGTGRTPDGKPVEDAPETVGKESTVKDPAKSTGETSGTGSGDPVKSTGETSGTGSGDPVKSTGETSGTGSGDPAKSTGETSGTGSGDPVKSTGETSGTGSGDPVKSTGETSGTGSGDPVKSTGKDVVDGSGKNGGAVEEFKPFSGTGRTPDGKPIKDLPETSVETGSAEARQRAGDAAKRRAAETGKTKPTETTAKPTETSVDIQSRETEAKSTEPVEKTKSTEEPTKSTGEEPKVEKPVKSTGEEPKVESRPPAEDAATTTTEAETATKTETTVDPKSQEAQQLAGKKAQERATAEKEPTLKGRQPDATTTVTKTETTVDSKSQEAQQLAGKKAQERATAEKEPTLKGRQPDATTTVTKTETTVDSKSQEAQQLAGKKAQERATAEKEPTLEGPQPDATTTTTEAETATKTETTVDPKSQEAQQLAGKKAQERAATEGGGTATKTETTVTGKGGKTPHGQGEGGGHVFESKVKARFGDAAVGSSLEESAATTEIVGRLTSGETLVRVRLADGTVHEVKVPYALGEAELAQSELAAFATATAGEITLLEATMLEIIALALVMECLDIYEDFRALYDDPTDPQKWARLLAEREIENYVDDFAYLLKHPDSPEAWARLASPKLLEEFIDGGIFMVKSGIWLLKEVYGHHPRHEALPKHLDSVIGYHRLDSPEPEEGHVYAAIALMSGDTESDCIAYSKATVPQFESQRIDFTAHAAGGDELARVTIRLEGVRPEDLNLDCLQAALGTYASFEPGLTVRETQWGTEIIIDLPEGSKVEEIYASVLASTHEVGRDIHASVTAEARHVPVAKEIVIGESHCAMEAAAKGNLVHFSIDPHKPASSKISEGGWTLTKVTITLTGVKPGDVDVGALYKDFGGRGNVSVTERNGATIITMMVVGLHDGIEDAHFRLNAPGDDGEVGVTIEYEGCAWTESYSGMFGYRYHPEESFHGKITDGIQVTKMGSDPQSPYGSRPHSGAAPAASPGTRILSASDDLDLYVASLGEVTTPAPRIWLENDADAIAVGSRDNVVHFSLDPAYKPGSYESEGGWNGYTTREYVKSVTITLEHVALKDVDVGALRERLGDYAAVSVTEEDGAVIIHITFSSQDVTSIDDLFFTMDAPKGGGDVTASIAYEAGTRTSRDGRVERVGLKTWRGETESIHVKVTADDAETFSGVIGSRRLIFHQPAEEGRVLADIALAADGWSLHDATVPASSRQRVDFTAVAGGGDELAKVTIHLDGVLPDDVDFQDFLRILGNALGNNASVTLITLVDKDGKGVGTDIVVEIPKGMNVKEISSFLSVKTHETGRDIHASVTADARHHGEEGEEIVHSDASSDLEMHVGSLGEVTTPAPRIWLKHGGGPTKGRTDDIALCLSIDKPEYDGPELDADRQPYIKRVTVTLTHVGLKDVDVDALRGCLRGMAAVSVTEKDGNTVIVIEFGNSGEWLHCTSISDLTIHLHVPRDGGQVDASVEYEAGIYDPSQGSVGTKIWHGQSPAVTVWEYDGEREQAQASFAAAKRELNAARGDLEDLTLAAEHFTLVTDAEGEVAVDKKYIACFGHDEFGDPVVLSDDGVRGSATYDPKEGSVSVKGDFEYRVSTGDGGKGEKESGWGRADVIRDDDDKMLLGGDGHDLIVAAYGAEAKDGMLLEGFGDDDVLLGGSAPDVLRGGDGDDRLEGRGGGDILIGGAGDDLVVLEQLGFRFIDGGAGSDTLRLCGSDPGQTLDGKTLLGDGRVKGIETIEVLAGDQGHRSLDLSGLTAKDLAGLSDDGAVLKVRGGDGAEVDLGDGYAATGAGTGDYRGYDGYDLDGDHLADIYVQHTMAVI